MLVEVRAVTWSVGGTFTWAELSAPVWAVHGGRRDSGDRRHRGRPRRRCLGGAELCGAEAGNGGDADGTDLGGAEPGHGGGAERRHLAGAECGHGTGGEAGDIGGCERGHLVS